MPSRRRITSAAPHSLIKPPIGKHMESITLPSQTTVSPPCRRATSLTAIAIGYNTPVIIKYPFWQMTAKNPNAIYACINQGQAVCPQEIERQTICIDADIDTILRKIMSEENISKSAPH